MARPSRQWIFLLVLFGLLTTGIITAPNSAEAAGAWVGDWTVIGDNGDNFAYPRGITVDNLDNVYVVDNGLNFIQKRSAGSTAWTIVTGYSFNDPQDWLMGIAADGANNIYVLNSIQNTSRVVLKYNGTTWTDITCGFSFRQPEAIAADSIGNIYVTDAYDNSGHVLKLAAGSTSWTEIGSWTNGSFEQVKGITVDIQNNLYVTDYSAATSPPVGRIMKLVSGTSTWQNVTNDGTYPRLQTPIGVVRDDFGNLYVADMNRNELHTVPNGSSSWAYIKNGDPNTFSDPYGVAVDSKGYVYVTDPTNGKVYKHAPWATQMIWPTQPGGTLAGSTLNPQPVVALAGPSGDIVISDSSGSVSVALTSPNGAALNGLTSTALSSGTASFSNLSVNNAGTYTLTATGTIDNTNIWDMNNVSGIGVTTVIGQSSSFTITAPLTAAVPTASPPSESTVANNSTVTLSTTTVGANIYYTTDGTNPTTSSPSGTSVVITGDPEDEVTVKAIAGGPGFTSSSIATFTYTLQPQVAAPTAFPGSGTTVANNTTVTLTTATAGATIYYTTDGSNPTTGSLIGPSVVITGTPGAVVTVKAMAAAPNMANSEIASFTYNLQPRAAAPTAVPASGSIVTNGATITLSTVTPGATIYYTTDGSDPTTASSSGSSVIATGASGATVTVKAMAAAINYVDSNISTFTYTIGEAVAAPTAEPVSGSTMANNSIVTLSTSTAGATIYYTTDGSDPTTNGTEGASVLITGVPEQEIIIKAYATAPGMANSEIVSFTYYLQSQAAAPTASLADGALVVDNTTVILEHPAPNAIIYYTIDGTTPTTASPSGSSLTITGSVGDTITVQALAVVPGMENSDIATFSYTIALQVEEPTASPTSGTTVANGTAVTLSTTTPGATIYYTTDGSDPSIGSSSGTSVTIAGIPESLVILKAFATAPGMVDSSIATFTYNLQPLTETPTAVPPSGSVVVTDTTVTMLTSMPDATIYYTLDGSDPTIGSDSGSSVVISGAPGDIITLKAMAAAPERENSDIATFTYTIGFSAESPTSSIPSGTTVANNTIVDLLSVTPNATIYYTLDGSDPTRNSLSGSSATISGAPAATVTLKAIAVAPDMADSDIATFTYYLQPQAASPTASPASGSTVENNTTVTLSTATAGAAIYYTTDGSTPTDSSTSGTSVTITGASWSTVTIKAFAAAPDMVDSDVAVFTYRIRSHSSGGSSGGGGGGTAPSGILVTPPGGTFRQSGVTLVFPAHAVEDDIRVQVKEISQTIGLSLPDNSQLLSKVVEIVKDTSEEFSRSVTITLSFEKSKTDPEKYDIKICYYDEEADQWVPLDNIQVNLTTGQVSGDVTHFTKFAVIATPKVSEAEKPSPPVTPTVDVPGDLSSHWAKESVMKLMEAGIISGYKDGTFQPDRTVTRAEFTVMLVKALKLETRDGKEFADTGSHWAADGISIAAACGIISGYNDSTFGPDDPVTREQAAVIMARAGRLDTAGELNFTDGQAISPWARSGVLAAVAQRFFSGYPDGSFQPQGRLTRAEAAVIIAKLLPN